MKFIEIDGKRYVWREIVKLRRQQLEAFRKAHQPPCSRSRKTTGQQRNEPRLPGIWSHPCFLEARHDRQRQSPARLEHRHPVQAEFPAIAPDLRRCRNDCRAGAAMTAINLWRIFEFRRQL